MKLAKEQTNELIEAIKAVDLDPRDFSYPEGEEEYRIEHKSSGSYFALDTKSAHYGVDYLIVGEVVDIKYTAYTWYKAMESFKLWIARVKRDIETPDLWAELQREPKLLGAGPEQRIENTPFTPDEQRAIVAILHQRSDYVKQTYPLSETQMLELNTQIAELTEAVHRLGRRDWRGLLIATLIEFAFYVAPEPAAARDMVFTFLNATGHFFGTHFPDLPIG
jgi:hypothetical protein